MNTTQKLLPGSENLSETELFPAESWMSVTYNKSARTTSMDLPSATSSPESGAGAMPCGSLAGPTTNPSGPAVARVSRSAPPAKGLARKTRVTFGRNSVVSSVSAARQQCLASRLQARLGATGSMEYSLTWKVWPMSTVPPICALRASAHRISANACSGEQPTGCPTPTCPVVTNGHEAGNNRYIQKTKMLVGWPTPRTVTGGAESAERKQELGRTESGGVDLQAVALLAGWAAPTVQDSANNAGPSQFERNSLPLNCEVMLVNPVVGWTTPQCHDTNPRGTGNRNNPKGGNACLAWDARGAISPLSHVGTENRGALNPAHSRWLMGFPAVWDSCGATAMQSCRKSRRNSSKPTWK